MSRLVVRKVGLTLVILGTLISPVAISKLLNEMSTGGYTPHWWETLFLLWTGLSLAVVITFVTTLLLFFLSWCFISETRLGFKSWMGF